MWPHQSSLREILRCVCYEKMEGSWVSCAASRGDFGFLCSLWLANFQERGALALDTCRCFPNQPSIAPTAAPRLPLGHRAPAPTGLPPILRKARPDVLSHGAVPRNDVGPRRPRSPRMGKAQAARSRCSRSRQQAQDAFNNMWEVISHNFLRICKPVSDPREGIHFQCSSLS